ncbi:murein L,D-transpeptidase YcbB/YkuD [Streptomyces phaeochromogenes]|uniref:peptidoglycan-binding domain-containing protein n=1 Tax=Streptomyces phaeochromogenes TaxID=1923 RepID=UPI002790F16B|nr:peptidoglycan-binding domain-containing protein [Streptomyces phaeochromogenes]MDQ0955905.1 murein L,D-transpeptidase YcbB/YkuD [Streptomyces phaeochromogenes]
MTIRRRVTALVTTLVMAGGLLAVAPWAAQAAPSAPASAQTEVGVQHYCGYYDGSATVRRGSKGDAVREVQCIINYWRGRHVLTVDGDFGEKTEEWVKEFQRGWGDKDDGIVGPLTWDRMRWGV